jgi:GNAT superfamily N-acetyltransferase
VPLYAGRLDLKEKIEVCRQHYRRWSLPTIFKVWPSAQGNLLDRALQKNHFTREAETSVQTCRLDAICASPAHSGASVQSALGEEWFDAYVQLSGVAAADCGKLRSILEHISPPVVYVCVRSEGRIASCGIGIVEGRDVGIFSLVTDPDLRNRGLGRQLIGHIAHWAHSCGAERAYLQVMTENAPAQSLLSQTGFCRMLPLLVPRGALLLIFIR